MGQLLFGSKDDAEKRVCTSSICVRTCADGPTLCRTYMDTTQYLWVSEVGTLEDRPRVEENFIFFYVVYRRTKTSISLYAVV